jgi:hypothetical protein
MPAKSMVNAYGVSEIFTPLLPTGQLNRPCSSRLANTQTPLPSQ